MMSFLKQIKLCFVLLSIILGQASADVYYLGGMFTQHYRDGTYAEWGKYSRLGANIAIKHVNDDDLLDGDKIFMPDENIIDYHCWNENVELMTQSLIKKNVLAIVGAECSDPAVLMANTAADKNVPIISYGANASVLSSEKNFPWFLRVITPSKKYEKHLLDLASKYGAKEIAVFHTTDTWGTGGALALQNAATEMNINIARVFSFPRDTSQTIIDDHIKALSETNLKHIFLISPTPDTVKFFKGINKYDLNKSEYKFYASEMILNNTPMDAIEGATGYFSPIAGLPDSEELDNYVKMYEKLSGETADLNSANFIYSVLSYDQILLVSEAIKLTKIKNLEVSRKNIMSELRQVNFFGASGKISFQNGSNDRLNMPINIMKFTGKKDGKMRFTRIAQTDTIFNELRLIKE